MSSTAEPKTVARKMNLLRFLSTLFLTSVFPEDLRKHNHSSEPESSTKPEVRVWPAAFADRTGAQQLPAHAPAAALLPSGLLSKKSSVSARPAGVTKHMQEIRPYINKNPISQICLKK